jgi:hypothetical protein
MGNKNSTKTKEKKKEKEPEHPLQRFCCNMAWHTVTLILIVITCLLYLLQIGLVFALFSVTPNAMIVAYASPGMIKILKKLFISLHSLWQQ